MRERSTSETAERKAERAGRGGWLSAEEGRGEVAERRGRRWWKRDGRNTRRESRDPHPAGSYNFNHQLGYHLLPPRGRVICEKHVDPRVEEGREDSFISSYISWKRYARTFVNVVRGVRGMEEQVEGRVSLGILGRSV